jgi:hypothetical protein
LKWKNLATAPDQLTAEMWCELLREAGIPAMIQPSDAVSFLGVSPSRCRVIVPEERYDEAAAVLREKMGGTIRIEPP